MGPNSAAEVDGWLSAGGIVVAASDRAARATIAAFHCTRQAEGLEAWTAPDIFDWQTFVRIAWQHRNRDSSLVLNPLQELWLWTELIAQSGHSASLLQTPRRRLASMATQAHALLCSYAPRYLELRARFAWQEDAAAFSDWLTSFDHACINQELISPHSLPLQLISLLEAESGPRSPLLLVGFDRLLPVQQEVFDAWGPWRHATQQNRAATVRHFAALDASAELAACAAWCRQNLAAHPSSRILVIVQDAAARRGEIERAFLRYADERLHIEFSLGIPLSEVALARSAHMLLSWLQGALREHEIDWLLSVGYGTASAEESTALQASMRARRRKGLQRTEWALPAFMKQQPHGVPSQWVERMTSAQQLLAAGPRERNPLEWSELIPQLLETIGWPGARALTSAEFQAARRFHQVVESCGSLGFAASRISWHEFLSELQSAMNETLFAPESEGAPVLIAGPAESAGLAADAVWFLGADEDAWPARGELHPLLPIDVQRDSRMPHASAQLDWSLAQAISQRVLVSAPQACFSYARMKGGIETRPSRLVTQLVGPPQPLPADLSSPPLESILTVSFLDHSRISFTPTPAVRGGSGILTAQSQCPFRAFALARLNAEKWDPAEAGLTAAERGKLLHSVLHSIWGGPPEGIRSLDELALVPDLHAFCDRHVRTIVQTGIPPRARQQMPARYVELEQQRLTRLVTEWLEYERARAPFSVDGTEIDAEPNIAGLPLKLRLDRLDRLSDGSFLVIDYKTGRVSPDQWELPRPEDVQLPLYAGFALAPEKELGGLVFARIRPGELCFTGRVGDASATLLPGLTARSALLKKKFEAEQLIDWREKIEDLARAFLAGRADVDPRDPPKTCERCGLQTLCRIHEREDVLEEDNGETEAIDD